MARSSKSTRPRILLVNRCIIENAKGEILLIRRAATDHWDAGLWEFPGGKLEVGQDITHALEREVLEETGLTIHTTSRICYVDGEILTSGKYAGLPYIKIFGKAKLVGGKLKLSAEHSQFKWLSPTKAWDLESTAETKHALAELY